MPGSKVATWHNKINKLSQSTSYCCLSKTRWNLSPHHLPQCRAESGIRYRHRPGTDQSITFFCCIHFPFEGYVLDKNCSRSFYVHHISIDLDIPPRDLQPRYSIKFWPIKWYLIYGISMGFSKSQRSRSVRSGEMRNFNRLCNVDWFLQRCAGRCQLVLVRRQLLQENLLQLFRPEQEIRSCTRDPT